MIRKFMLALACLFMSGALFAQENIVYQDASVFPVYGKCFENTSGRYERLPAELEGKIRPKLWELGRNSAGLYVRFRTNSTAIWVNWSCLFKNSMNHQTLIGTRGLDLYALEEGTWRHVNSVFPLSDQKVRKEDIVQHMDGQMREYMLYLSLYDGVEKLEIGVDEGAILEAPQVDSPRHGNPIVMYGTSILQGGCANRPGMAFTSIIGRRLDREVINMGFSGNGRLDPEIAEVMAKVEHPAVFVLDYVPNVNGKRIDEAGEAFFRILRDAHPEVPIIFVENPMYTQAHFDTKMQQDLIENNSRQRALFEQLKKSGEKRIFYVKSDGLTGEDREGAVDGVHLTDLGMMRMADAMMPALKKALKFAK